MSVHLFYLITSIVMFFLLPILLFAYLFIGWMEFPGLFERSGLNAKELGLLVAVSTVGMLSDIPVIIYRNSLLAINVGGAIVPIVISVYFWVNKKINLGVGILSIVIISTATYFVTSYNSEIGVTSEFPYYLLPVLFAFILSLALYRTDVGKSAPLAYISASLGVLIGADFVRIPEIFKVANL